jgi:hypothetical protein
LEALLRKKGTKTKASDSKTIVSPADFPQGRDAISLPFHLLVLLGMLLAVVSTAPEGSTTCVSGLLCPPSAHPPRQFLLLQLRVLKEHEYGVWAGQVKPQVS